MMLRIVSKKVTASTNKHDVDTNVYRTTEESICIYFNMVYVSIAFLNFEK